MPEVSIHHCHNPDSLNVSDIKLHLEFPDKHIHKLLLLILVLCVLESSPFLHLAGIPAFVPKVFFFGVPIGKC